MEMTSDLYTLPQCVQYKFMEMHSAAPGHQVDAGGAASAPWGDCAVCQGGLPVPLTSPCNPGDRNACIVAHSSHKTR